MFSRRAFLSTPMAFGVNWISSLDRPHVFAVDHVLGTSLRLSIWASSPGLADNAADLAFQEIDRLDGILSTYRADSEISRLGTSALKGSPERARLLALYDLWAERTSGAITRTIRGRLDINALGKAFIVDETAARLRAAARGVDAFILDIGGDIVVFNRTVDVSVADPSRWYDTDLPLTVLRLNRGAVATSGTYARGRHLIDPRTGEPVDRLLGVTAVASDCVTANALTTAACVLRSNEGARLATDTGAEMLTVTRSGDVRRSNGFALLERDPGIRSASMPLAAWPSGYEVGMVVRLKGSAAGAPTGRFGFGGRGGRGGGRGGARPPYVAIWIESPDGRPIRTVAVWGNESRWLRELPDWLSLARQHPSVLAITRATRPAGEYRVAWNGLDDAGNPVPTGTYMVNLEINREHGTYGRRSGTLVCGDRPSMVTLQETAECDPIDVTYGPRPSAV